MEFKTCEEYVLDRLSVLEEENARLSDLVDRLSNELLRLGDEYTEYRNRARKVTRKCESVG